MATFDPNDLLIYLIITQLWCPARIARDNMTDEHMTNHNILHLNSFNFMTEMSFYFRYSVLCQLNISPYIISAIAYHQNKSEMAFGLICKSS